MSFLVDVNLLKPEALVDEGNNSIMEIAYNGTTQRTE